MWGRLGLFYAIVVSLIGAVGWFYVENAGGHEDFGYDENVGDDLKIGIVAFDLINTEVFKIVIKSDPSIGKLSWMSFLIEICVMRKYEVSDSWIKQMIDLSYCSLPFRHVADEQFYPVAFGNNGHILIRSSKYLFCYSMKSTNLEYLCQKMTVVGLTNYV